MTAQFDAAEALLQELQAETKAVRFAVEEQKERIDLTVQEVEGVVKEMKEGESRTRDEMREVREEVQNIREMLPKVRNCDSLKHILFMTWSRCWRRIRRVKLNRWLNSNRNSSP